MEGPLRTARTTVDPVGTPTHLSKPLGEAPFVSTKRGQCLRVAACILLKLMERNLFGIHAIAPIDPS